MNFSQSQVIWIQDRLEKLEKDFDVEKEKLRKELYQMKKEIAEKEAKEDDPFMGSEC